MPNDDIHEQLREEFYRKGKEEWKKSVQKRLNDIFSIIGDTSDKNSSLYFSEYKFETLDKVRNGIELGDRKAMLALLAITADALHAFEVLPDEVRKAPVYGLEKIRINLHEAKGFLPIGSGKSSESAIRAQNNKEYWIALSVEHIRFYDGCKLDEAIEKVAQEKRLSESLVQKSWRNKHKVAKKTLEMISSISKRPRKKVVSKPRRKR